jgi:hypothetical protein
VTVRRQARRRETGSICSCVLSVFLPAKITQKLASLLGDLDLGAVPAVGRRNTTQQAGEICGLVRKIMRVYFEMWERWASMICLFGRRLALLFSALAAHRAFHYLCFDRYTDAHAQIHVIYHYILDVHLAA